MILRDGIDTADGTAFRVLDIQAVTRNLCAARMDRGITLHRFGEMVFAVLYARDSFQRSIEGASHD